MYAHEDRAAVFQVGHPDHGRQRQGRMRRSDFVHVERLAIGRRLAVELVTIPRAAAGLVLGRVFLWILPDPVDLVGITDLVAATLAHRLRAVRPEHRLDRKSVGGGKMVSDWL